MNCMNRVFLPVIWLCAATAAAWGQQPGDVLWTADLDPSPNFSEPTVGPDGTIYVHTGRFYAIAPDGSIRWSQPLSSANVADVGPDGTVYAASTHTVHAFSPDGAPLWTFTETPTGQGVMAGPSVGPDGNVYVIFDAPGMGAVSLTPQGELRWSTAGFINWGGTGLTKVQFGADRFYFAEEVVPGCDPDGLQQGLVAVLLDDGDVDWCAPLSAAARPMADSVGRAYQKFSFSALRAYEPDGSVAWTFGLPPGSNTVIGPGVGPDGAAYLNRNSSQMWAINADGSVRWTMDDPPGGTFRVRASVAADNAALVYGTQHAPGSSGIIIARDPGDGSLLWSVPIPGANIGAAAPAAFSADGSVVYVPVRTSAATHLLAVQVHPDDGPPAMLGDLNDDGLADGLDLGILLANWSIPAGAPGCGGAASCTADINQDGLVNGIDLGILLANWTL